MNKHVPRQPRLTPLPLLAPALMMVFWMLLGGASGINITQSLWRYFDFEVGRISIAVPVGGVVGAAAGALLGLISNPRLLVLLMAVFAGSAAGAVAGRLPWGDLGEISGQVLGGLVGALAWTAWFLLQRDAVGPLRNGEPATPYLNDAWERRQRRFDPPATLDAVPEPVQREDRWENEGGALKRARR